MKCHLMLLLTRIRGAPWAVLLLSALAQSVAAQIPGLESPQTAAQSQQQVEDPLGRTTPVGTIAAFIRAVDRDDFVSAARYMQVSAGQRANVNALARDLKGLMDRYLSEALTSISNSPNGALDDGLRLDRERIGPLTIGEQRIYISLVRVADPQAGPIWLISSETLAQVPALHAAASQSWIERAMPASLVNHELFGISLAHWLVLVGSLLIPFVLLTLLFAMCMFVARRVVSDPTRRRELDAWYAGLRWPLILVVTMVIQLMSMPSLGFPLRFRGAYGRVGLVVAVIAIAWLSRRLLTLAFARARSMVWGSDPTSTKSLMLLGERLIKAFIAVVAIVCILLIVGVDSKTALAGFGIVGIALALGAQRTVENLLGGIFMLSDRAIAVGDLCSISNRLGWIEDITLRSVRLRTLDNTVVSMPAGVLAQAGIENFATRQKILAQSILRLRHGTSVEQLRRILDGIRKLLDEDTRIERGTARVRLVNFAAEAIELELFAYVLTADVPEFLAVREDLLLKIATVIAAAGSDFAQPKQFIYIEDEPDVAAATRTPTGRTAQLQR